MLWAFANDVFQRLVTFDKLLQRQNLRDEIVSLGLKPGAKVLDFGCGTALFARVFQRKGMRYFGYDISQELLDYASAIYPEAVFLSNKDSVSSSGEYDLIISNCCFHHIDDTTLRTELEQIHFWLKPDGYFMIMDLFEEGPQKSALRRLFLLMERGAFFREPEEYQQTISQVFNVLSVKFEALPLFPWKFPGNPIASNLMVMVCRKS
ncbi:MAG: class I SAM-dependent methyltransferase [Desulfarculus sp.]|nr:class I SAM-dependent methyltransferase [Desulfarculus sp.]